MNAIRIKDMHPRGFLAFDLKDILEIIDDKIIDSKWTCKSVEATYFKSPHLEEICEKNNMVSSNELKVAAQNTNQVIDGIFTATLNGSEWLRIEAIDSTYWEVYTSNKEILEILCESFNRVERINS